MKEEIVIKICAGSGKLPCGNNLSDLIL